MALAPSTANWHWKNKNVTRWGEEWFKRELATIVIAGDSGEQVSITRVSDVEGDVELGQRKSKLITIYDCKIDLVWSGTASDGTQVGGTLSIPEVSHEITLDRSSDYAFNWTLDTEDSSPAVEALFAFAKARLSVALETKLAEFPSALIDTHGKDLTVSAAPSRSETPGPGTRTPAGPTPGPSSAPVPAQTQPQVKQITEKLKVLNMAHVSVEATFMASAEDLFSLFTDEKRIPSWSRAPAKSTPEPGAEYALFSGGVTGKYVSLKRPSEIVQTWALQSPTWPSGHAATLTTTLVQSTDSTTIKLRLDGVPTGMEEELRRSLEGYYIHGFKSIGLGSAL